MQHQLLLEIFGYIGSAFVVISMLMTNVVKLRIVNMVGSVISGTYALIIGSLPLGIMNFCLIVINAINLFKLLKTNQKFGMVKCKKDDGILQFFLEHYDKDINKYFTGYEKIKNDFDTAYVVCIDGEPAGATIGKVVDDSVYEIVVDYSIPAYRDCSVGKYLYSRLPEYGIKTLKFKANTCELHEAYLKKVGYELKGDYFVKELN